MKHISERLSGWQSPLSSLVVVVPLKLVPGKAALLPVRWVDGTEQRGPHQKHRRTVLSEPSISLQNLYPNHGESSRDGMEARIMTGYIWEWKREWKLLQYLLKGPSI